MKILFAFTLALATLSYDAQAFFIYASKDPQQPTYSAFYFHEGTRCAKGEKPLSLSLPESDDSIKCRCGVAANNSAEYSWHCEIKQS